MSHKVFSFMMTNHHLFSISDETYFIAHLESHEAWLRQILQDLTVHVLFSRPHSSFIHYIIME